MENVEFETLFARRADVMRFRILNQNSLRQGRQTRAPVYERGLCFAGHQKEREPRDQSPRRGGAVIVIPHFPLISTDSENMPGGQTERRFRRRSTKSIISLPPARWVAASATAKFTTLYGKYPPPTKVMASSTHSDGTNGHFGDGGVAARKSNQNSGILFLSVDRRSSHQRIRNAHGERKIWF